MNGKTFEDLAAAGYKAYCKQAGGVTFDNKTLPHWSQIGENRQACWIAAAKEVVAQNSTPVFKAAAEQPIDNYSLATSQPSECATIYQFSNESATAADVQVAPAVFSSGGGGDYGGGGASGNYDSSSSDSSSSSSDGGSSSSDGGSSSSDGGSSSSD